QMGLVFKMYASESRGESYPAVAMNRTPMYDCDTRQPTGEIANNLYLWAPRMDSIYPEYLTDFGVLLCPSNVSVSEDDLKNPETGAWEAHMACLNEAGTAASTDRGISLLDHHYWY